MMNLQLMLTVQLIADAVLCLAIVFLFAIVNREIKKKNNAVDAESMSEFKSVIAQSQAASEELLKAMDESRRILKEIAYAIDDKERRLRALLDASEARLTAWQSREESETGKPTERIYGSVVEMARAGATTRDIADRLGLTEGEVSLVIELDRKKNESL
jgi:DNA-binding NarL/FixJ family response regulator